MLMRRAARLFALALLVSLASAALIGQADPFQRVAFLVGRWQGTTEGQPGEGSTQREYVRVMSSRFKRVTNQSRYPVQPQNPKGEVHEDEGFISF